MDLKLSLGKNIQKYRKLQGITQEKLAEMLDIDINSVSALERGKNFPSTENLSKISEVLDVPLADLFTFVDDLTCADYEKEILRNIKLVRNDKLKLSAVNAFIKNLL